jgi:hypothetical protein
MAVGLMSMDPKYEASIYEKFGIKAPFCPDKVFSRDLTEAAKIFNLC